MNPSLRGVCTAVGCLAALTFAALLPARAAAADTVILTNNTGVAVAVQGSCVVKGNVVRNPNQVVQPGDSIRIALPGNKLITVSDAKLLKPLYTGTIPGAAEDLYFVIQFDPRVNKVFLEPAKPPKAP